MKHIAEIVQFEETLTYGAIYYSTIQIDSQCRSKRHCV